MAMVVFLELNNNALEVTDDDAVETMLSIAAGQTDEAALMSWLSTRVRPVSAST